MAVLVDRSLHDRLSSLFASDPETMAEAQLLFRELREEAPAYVHDSAVLFSRHADARALIRDEGRVRKGNLADSRVRREARERMTEAERRAFDEVSAFEATMLVHTDGDEHARLRGIAHRAFTPARIASLETSVRGYLEGLLAPLADQDEADLMTFAYELPLMVISELLGVPEADRYLIRSWSEEIAANKVTIPNPAAAVRAAEAIARFREYVEAMLAEQRRSSSSSDLAATLGDRLTTQELTANFVMLLFAGHETTTNLISIGLSELLQRRDQWDALCADPVGLGPSAVEELLRFVTPVQWQHRVACTDFEQSGVSVREGDMVFAMLAGANRDPDVFREPERLDIRRTDSKAHLALGFGTHFCLGASLARLEARVALETFAGRFPELELGTTAFRWCGSALLRRLESLPVSLGRRLSSRS